MRLFGWLRREDGKRLDVSLRIDMARDLTLYLREQLNELARLNVPVCINEITAAYILNLLSVSRRSGVNPHDASAAAKGVFHDTDENHALIDNAFQILAADAEAPMKLAALFSLVQREVSAGKFVFLVRHSQKAEQTMEALSKQVLRRDLRNVPSWSPNDLA